MTNTKLTEQSYPMICHNCISIDKLQNSALGDSRALQLFAVQKKLNKEGIKVDYKTGLDDKIIKKYQIQFLSQHGIYQCKKCKSVSAPELLDEKKNPVKLYWNSCHSCYYTDKILKGIGVNYEDQEHFIQIQLGDGTVGFALNDEQKEISCKHCGHEGLKTNSVEGFY